MDTNCDTGNNSERKASVVSSVENLGDCEMAEPQVTHYGGQVPADEDIKVQAATKQKLIRTGPTSAYKPHYRMEDHDMLETAEHSKIRMQLSATSTGPEEYQHPPGSVSSIPGPSGLGRLQPGGTFPEDHRQPLHNSHMEYHARFRGNTQNPDSVEYQQVPREDALDHYKVAEIKDPQDEDTVDHPPDLGWLLDKDPVVCEQDLKKETITQDAPHASVMSPSLNTPQPSVAVAKGLVEHGQELQGTLGSEKTSVGSAAASSSLPYTLVTSAGMLSSLVQSFANSCSTLSPMLCSAPVNITAASSSSLTLLCTPVNVTAGMSQLPGHTDSTSFLPQTSVKSDGPSSLNSSCMSQTYVNSKDTLSPSTTSSSEALTTSSLSHIPANTSNAFSLPQTFLGNMSSFSLLPQFLAEKFAPLLSSLPEASVSSTAASSAPSGNTVTSSSLPPSAINSDGTPLSLPQMSQDTTSKFPFLHPLNLANTTPVSLLQQVFQNSISTTCMPPTSVTVSATSLTSVGTVSTSASLTGTCTVTSSASSMPLTSVGIPSSQPQTIVNNNATFSFSPQLVVYNITPLLVVPETLYNSVFTSSSTSTSPTQTPVSATGTASSATLPLVQRSAPSASMYRPYSCQYCSAAYARPSSLTSHMKNCRHAPKETGLDKPLSPSADASADDAVDDASDKQSSSSSEAAADSGEDDSGQDDTEVADDQPTCDKCSQTFDTDQALRKHMKSHKDKPYKCVDCGKSFAATWHLRRHELIHTEGKKPFQCKVCPKSFAFAKVLEEHMRRHAGDRPFVCEVCNKGFYSSNYLRKHMRHHTNSKHVCDVCNKTFDFGADLKNHKKTHASTPPGRATLPQKSGLCELCGKKFANASFLRKHVCKNENHLGKALSCDTCGKTFTSRVCLQIHVHSKHKDWVDGLEEDATRSKRKDSAGHLKELSQSGPEPFVCHVCGKVLKTSATLQEHVRGHTDQKPFVCGICNKGFMHRIHLRKHQHIHTGVKDFTCEVCQKTFISSQTLKLHYKNIHLGDRPYMCDVCNQGFATKTTLKLHKLKHSDEKPFVCDVCNKGFKYECVLKNHKLLHTGEKPYKCDMCEKAYVCFNYLAKHKRTHAAPKYTCDVCGKTCFFANELKNHKLSHSDEKPFLCDVCSKAFPTETRLRTHKLIHSEDKSFACNLCDKAFPSVSFLNRHLKRAHPDRSFVCDVCMKPFKHYETLRDHMNVHLNVKNFVCGDCGKGFHSAGSLRTHKKLKHTEIETPFVCNVCGKGFPFHSYLKSHEKVHSKDKNLVCELCNKAVKYKLWRHMKKVHNL